MPRVRCRWFAWALAPALLVPLSGCRWLPIRRGEPFRLAQGPDADPANSAAPALPPIPTTEGEPAVPPLLEPISDEEALGPSPTATTPQPPTPTNSPTPLLDAAIARARAERALIAEAAREPEPTPRPAPQPPPVKAPTRSVPTPPSPTATTAELPPPDEPAQAPNVSPAPGPDTPPEPLPIAPSSLTTAAPHPGPVVRASGDSGWDEAVDRLRALARDQAGRDGVHRTDWELRERALTALGEPRPGNGRDRAWQAVATILAEPVPPPSNPNLGPNQPIAEAVSALDPVEARPAGPIIADLALCRRVRGFAEYDPIDPANLRAGRRVIVYSQISGVRYEPTGDRFRSCLSSKIELIRVGSRTAAWSQDFEPAEDVCRAPRQDYYASYTLQLPTHLEPGTYHLRLTQFDTLSELEASRELTLTLRP